MRLVGLISMALAAWCLVAIVFWLFAKALP